MQCKHYKGDGYTYKLNDKEEINLCEQCEMNLYAEMVRQAAIEMKMQTVVNDMHQAQMDQADEFKAKLKKAIIDL